MAAYLRFVSHAAERHADELAPEGFGDRAREGRLADAGRSDEAEDRPLDAGFSFSTARYSRMRSFAFSSPE